MDTTRPQRPDSPCVCLADDAVAARDAIQRMPTVDWLIDDSHYIVSIRRCEVCGRLFLVVSTELIDWDDGYDSHAALYAPITGEEAQQLRRFGDDLTERDIAAVCGARRHIHDVSPRGRVDYDDDDAWMGGVPESKPEPLRWIQGPVFILPHD